jgi:hypothetical protein
MSEPWDDILVVLIFWAFSVDMWYRPDCLQGVQQLCTAMKWGSWRGYDELGSLLRNCRLTLCLPHITCVNTCETTLEACRSVIVGSKCLEIAEKYTRIKSDIRQPDRCETIPTNDTLHISLFFYLMVKIKMHSDG